MAPLGAGIIVAFWPAKSNYIPNSSSTSKTVVGMPFMG